MKAKYKRLLLKLPVHLIIVLAFFGSIYAVYAKIAEIGIATPIFLLIVILLYSASYFTSIFDLFTYFSYYCLLLIYSLILWLLVAKVGCEPD